jgi:hypothetical protein
MLDVIKKAHEMGMDVSISDAQRYNRSMPENMVVVIVHNHKFECRAIFEKQDKESQRCFINEVCDLYGRI